MHVDEILCVALEDAKRPSSAHIYIKEREKLLKIKKALNAPFLSLYI